MLITNLTEDFLLHDSDWAEIDRCTASLDQVHGDSSLSPQEDQAIPA
jgi:hypothetical protein